MPAKLSVIETPKVSNMNEMFELKQNFNFAIKKQKIKFNCENCFCEKERTFCSIKQLGKLLCVDCARLLANRQNSVKAAKASKTEEALENWRKTYKKNHKEKPLKYKSGKPFSIPSRVSMKSLKAMLGKDIYQDFVIHKEIVRREQYTNKRRKKAAETYKKRLQSGQISNWLKNNPNAQLKMHHGGKCYKFNGLSFDSSIELCFYIYFSDMGRNIIREPKDRYIKYTKNGKEVYTFPDFEMDGQLYELKGSHLIDEDGTILSYHNKVYSKEIEKTQALKEHNVTIIKDVFCKEYVDYVKNTYGKNFIKESKYVKDSSSKSS